jgi:Transposase DDE domain
MTLDPARYFRTLKTLDTFIDRSLELKPKSKFLSGFHYNRDLLKASVANTYVETVGNRADSLHLAIKKVPASNIYWEYLETVKILGTKFELQEKEVVLAFDYTDEDFYGDPQGFWIHGWTGENGVTGKFKFLTCSIVSSDIPQKIPLISIPVRMGHNMAHAVTWCLTVIEPMVKSISLTLFDRGFYSKELMLTLYNSKYPYLIFVPKNPRIRKELAQMEEAEKKIMQYKFKLNVDKTVLKGETTLALLKQIFDNRSDKSYDWAFATNQSTIDLDHIITSYKRRWRIETGFRIQDEAHIKSKSTDVNVRFFYFAYEQVLQLLWIILYKDEESFKVFMIDTYEECLKRYKDV